MDQNGDPVVGAVVMVQGTSNGSVTQENGAYVLTNVPSDAKLEASCMGYETQVISVSGRNLIDFYLEDDAEMVEETVVIGYAVQNPGF